MKKSVNDLALFGGAPAFEQPLHVGWPNTGDRERFLKRVNDLLDRRWLTNKGPYVLELERKIAEFTGAKHCIAMCNGTIALEIAIRALGLTGEVIVPSFTFIATAHALKWQEITPVFCDIDPVTHAIDPKRVEELITERTTGIIGVDLWGKPCAIEELQGIARKHDIKLLFDAAHAFGVSYKGKMIGNFGDAEVFSFHATKFFNTLEGGAVVTNDDALASKIRLMKNFGFSGIDHVVSVGTNGKMNEISAAMGLTQLEDIDQLINTNRRHYKEYKQGLAGIDGIRVMNYDVSEKANYQYIVIDVDERAFGTGRNRLVEILKAENIFARRYFYPGCHKMEPYRSQGAPVNLPVTERVSARVISLPSGSAVGPEAIAKICEVIRLIGAQEHNCGRGHM
ncbi:MAG: aminotransferase class I/II-fold pyridoxal phosphate-dependent enzyme [Candidatus Omnitrophica bacterium]|nr:aminotransferase class I/II-fold pyridoxal phosphate-dependent enzyme [Candidatus Omnitrophota bacterium]